MTYSQEYVCQVEPTWQQSEAPAAAVSADECWSSQSQHGPELRTLNSGLSFPNSKVRIFYVSVQ